MSVIIPVYNEERTVEKLIRRVDQVNVDKEIIVMDDGSSGQTPAILETLKNKYSIRIFHHPTNKGKGMAIRTGLGNCTKNRTTFLSSFWAIPPSSSVLSNQVKS